MKKGVLQGILKGETAVGVVETSSAIALSFKSALRGAGFSKIYIFSSFREAMSSISSGGIGWLICQLNEKDKFNGLKLLERVYAKEGYQIKISFMLNDDQIQILPTAFSMGLFSYHPSSFKTVDIETEIGILRRMITEHQTEAKVSAVYLRNYLKKDQNWNELIHLETSLASHFPTDEVLLLNLAEAYYYAGDVEKSRSILDNTSFLDERLLERSQKLLMDDKDEQSRSQFAQKYQINGVAIIDQDAQAVNIIKSSLEKAGIANIYVLEDGNKAVERLEDHNGISLIISEWKVPGLSGPALLQRLRCDKYRHVPLVLASAQLKKQDAQLLHEMKVAQTIKKPLREKQILMAVAWVMRQSIAPSEGKALERKIIEAVEVGQINYALKLRNNLVRHAEVGVGRKLFIDGYIAYTNKDFPKAKRLLVKAIKESVGQKVDILDLLGSVLLALGDTSGASRLMEKASVFSPTNIERLCRLVDVNLQEGDHDRAKEFLDMASKIDVNSPDSVGARINLAMSFNDSDRAQQLLSEVSDIATMIRCLNNHAVALNRSGQIWGGVELYKQGLALLTEEFYHMKPILEYNIGVSFLRLKDSHSATIWLEKVQDFGDSRVYDKALNWLHRIRSGLDLDLTVKEELAGGSLSVQDQVILGEFENKDVIKVNLRGVYSALEESQLAKNLNLPSVS